MTQILAQLKLKVFFAGFSNNRKVTTITPTFVFITPTMKNKMPLMFHLNVLLLIGLLLSFGKLQAGQIEPAYEVEKTSSSIHINDDYSYTDMSENLNKVITPYGIEVLSEYQISFKDGLESVEVLEAYTIQPDGKRINVAKDKIFVETESDEDDSRIHNDRKQTVIIYPKLVVGGKTYVRYIKRVKSQVFKHTLQLMKSVSPNILVREGEFNVEYNSRLPLFTDKRDMEGGRIEDGKNGLVRYHFTYSNLVAYAQEDNQIDSIDFSPYAQVSSFKSPVEYGQEFQKGFDKNSRITNQVKALAEEITAGITDDFEQAKAIYEWVTKEIRYTALGFGDKGLVPHEADTIHNRYGDCKDHDNLLITLLAAKNIDATSALINLGESYRLTKLGSSIPFNHVITYLPKWDLYLDSTQNTAPFGILAGDIQGKPTVLTKLNRIGQTPTATPNEVALINHTQITILGDGRMNGTTSTQYKGSPELGARLRYSQYSGSQKEDIVNHHLKATGSVGSGEFTVTDVHDLKQPLKVEGKFQLDPLTNFPGEGAFSIPLGLADSDIHRISKHKLDEKLVFPQFCQSRNAEDTVELSFPEHTQITKIPEAIDFDDGLIQYHSSYVLEGNTVKVHRKLISNRKTNVCIPSEMMENWNNFLKVLKRDVRGQVFYRTDI
jgi:hypothetical protein